MDSLDQISNAALKLPEADRLRLAEQLYQSIGESALPLEVRDEWIEEIYRRRARYLSGDSKSYSAEQTLHHMQQRIDEISGSSS